MLCFTWCHFADEKLISGAGYQLFVEYYAHNTNSIETNTKNNNHHQSYQPDAFFPENMDGKQLI